MNDEEALVRTILTDRADDTVRLAYADWLQERGDDLRAEFICVQIELARCGPEPVKIGFGNDTDTEGSQIMRRCGPDYWQFYTAHQPRPKVGDRVDVKRGWMKPRRKDRTYHGLLVTNVEPEDYGAMITVKRDEHSKPWPGTELKKKHDKLLRDYWDVVRNEEPYRHFVADGVSLDVGVMPRLTFTRGFVSQVRCWIDDWLRLADGLYWHPDQQVKCPSCGGRGSVRHGIGSCSRCGGNWAENGSGRVNRPFPGNTWPLERVVLVLDAGREIITTQPLWFRPPGDPNGEIRFWWQKDGTFRCPDWPDLAFEFPGVVVTDHDAVIRDALHLGGV